MSSNSSTGSPCGACKFLRRKCASDCVFAPYFSNEHGSSRFAAIHKVFGASNAAKLLLHVPQHERCEAVVTIAYEAQARVRDPVYGCVSHIFALQQQVASLQAQLMQTKAQLARGTATSSRSVEEQCRGNIHDPFLQYNYAYAQSMSPQSSLDGVENNFDYLSMQTWNKRMAMSNESGELHDLASRMMRN